MYEVGAGYISKVRWQRSQGHLFDLTSFTPEEILAKYDAFTNFEKGFSFPTSNEGMMAEIMKNIEAQANKKTTTTPAATETKKTETTTTTTTTTAPTGGLKSDEIFGMMATYLA